MTSQGVEGVRFGDFRIGSLLFADDVALLAPSVFDLQLRLDRFADECKSAPPELREHVSGPARERLGIPPEELDEVSGEREVWAAPLRPLPPRPHPGQAPPPVENG